MSTKSKDNSRKKILIIIIILVILLVLLLLFTTVIRKNVNKSSSPDEIEKAEIETSNEKNKQIKADLSEKTEQQRMEYYCSNFFDLIDIGNYKKAYSLLDNDYKENFFPTIQNFERYFEEYFPSEFSLSFTNIERLGEIYVLMTNVNDNVNGSSGHNFDMYVVLKENSLNDYVISFSRNSAVDEEE